eukprot:CAMPEP_0168242294 /NCGR_PEP_ID=MMETSP0140_2-20121125/23326_1 /TAXON_ID=44445 /ORGANISM="Pseudo-nitzschia australis, Strain 10249 10 AB" /LENGTH=730 /DNA_ID=CAMNT_0008177351 /DNA_START=627 /DNA_END=2821 /DNA_ORIENTATION=-
MDEFVVEEGLLQYQVARLFFITFHIQIGVGYLGIDFLKQEQHRRNELVRMDMGSTVDEENKIKTNETTMSTPASKKVLLHDDENKNSNDMSSTKTTSQPYVVEDKKMKRSLRFQRTAAPYIFLTAVPYMVKVIGYGNLNAFAFVCMRDDIHRAVRLYDLFDHDNHLVALADHSAKAPADFAGYMDTIVSTTYDLFNRKLFSLPKVMLLPVVMSRQPKMIARIFPIIFISDWLKGKAVSYMTSRIEELEKDVQELNAVRARVESYDLKNSELLHRSGSGAIDFTKQRWLELTVKKLFARCSFFFLRVSCDNLTPCLQSSNEDGCEPFNIANERIFFFYPADFVFSVLVDCALAQLMAVGKIVSSDIFVFSRAIEDAVDMILMRSRSEAELARMMTQISNLKELSIVWKAARQRNLLPCNLGSSHGGDSLQPLIVFKNIAYSRGTAAVQIDNMELPAGIYALTGANGSGKSTLFRVIMGCNTNDRPIDIPPSISLSIPSETSILSLDGKGSRSLDSVNDESHPRPSITMPSSHAVEISQTFYWPLYSKPIDWILQQSLSENITEKKMKDRCRRVAELLHSLEFTQSLELEEVADNGEGSEVNNIVVSSPTGDAITRIMEDLNEVKEDWFNDLSGGQRSKVELVRKVFLMDECPHILLVDETMAPLDPRSKALVMSQIKSFCAGSVVVVIYHTDVGRGQEKEGGELVECVPSNDFFDSNIHVEDKTMILRPVC